MYCGLMNILKCYSIIKLILIISFIVNADRLLIKISRTIWCFLLKKSAKVFHDHFTNAYKHASYGDIIELAGKTNGANIKFVLINEFQLLAKEEKNRLSKQMDFCGKILQLIIL